MSEVIKAYPLQWPAGWKRTQRRAEGKFTRYGQQLSVADGVTRVLAELGRFGIRDADIVISTNVPTRLDGIPRSDVSPTAGDPGVCVYWRRKGETKCMAVDIYARVADNLAAVAATLEAMRAIERHGGAAILDRAFTGFTALPAPMTGQKPWRDVLAVSATESKDPAIVRAAYMRKRGEAHPDRHGGDHDDFLAVQSAYEQAARELGFTP